MFNIPLHLVHIDGDISGLDRFEHFLPWAPKELGLRIEKGPTFSMVVSVGLAKSLHLNLKMIKLILMARASHLSVMLVHT